MTPNVSRRHMLRSLALAGAGFAVVDRAVAQAAPLRPLGQIAATRGLLFGGAYDLPLLSDPRLKALMFRESAIATIENALKFDWLRPKGPQADFTNADQLVALGNGAGIKVRGTALVWNDNLPPWLKALSPRETRTMMERHIDEVAGRYAGRIHSWDVVNEPFSPWDRQAGHWRKGPWFAAFGPDYVAHALRRAALSDRQARLVLNEAFCEQDDEIGKAVRPALLGLVRDLKGRDVPLHAVGLQAHLKPQLPFDDAGFVRFVEEIAACGVEIYITELDVDDSSYPDDAAMRDEAVARRYEDFLAGVLAVPAVRAVITWGLDDRHSWYRDLALRQKPALLENAAARRLPRPLPFDDTGAPKAAAHALARAFAGAPTHSGSHRR